jgi:hypothetical protein
MANTRPHNSVLGKIMQPTACVDPCVGVRIIAIIQHIVSVYGQRPR